MNTQNGNTFYVDTASSVLTSNKNIKVVGIVFTSNGAGDNMVLRDGSVSGAIKLSVKNGAADDSQQLEFEIKPMLFPNGIYVDTLDTGAVATIIITSGEST